MPNLSAFAVRGGHAARESQLDAGPAHRPARRKPPEVRHAQTGRRSVRQLPSMSSGMSGGCRHPQADARMQSPIRVEQRPDTLSGISRTIGLRRQLGQFRPPVHQLGPGQSGDAMAAGENTGDRPRPKAAPGGRPQLSATSRATPPDIVPRAAKLRKSSISSTSTPTGSIPNWPKHSLPSWNIMAFRSSFPASNCPPPCPCIALGAVAKARQDRAA